MKIIRHVSRAARYALFAIIVGSAFALSVLRFWLLPEVSSFREQLQAKAGDLLGESVRIGTLSASMQWLQPQLVLHDVSILPREQTAAPIILQRVRLGLDLAQSLVQGSPVLASLHLEGARIGIMRRRDGRIGIRGLASGGQAPGWLFSLGGLVLRDIDLEWEDEQSGSTVVRLGRLNARGRNENARHRLSAALQPAQGAGMGLKVIADLSGESPDPDDWRGALYLEGEELPLGLGAAMHGPFRGGLGSARLWGRWGAGRLESAKGSLHLHQPILALRTDADTEAQVALDDVQAGVLWERTGTGWLVALHGLRLTLAGEAVPETDVAAEVAQVSGARTLRAAVSSLRLEDLGILRNFLPAGTWKEALEAMAPRGRVEQVQWVMDEAGAWGFCGQVHDAAFNAWKGVPGTGHLNGRICGNDRRGGGALSIAGAALQARHLWSGDVPLDSLSAAFRWERDGQGLHVAMPDLTLEAPGLHARAALFALLPSAGAAPFIDLQASLTDVDARLLRHYLPLSAMPAISARWLRDAFIAGRIERADLLLHGPLDEFPFRGGEGVFQARTQVKNLELAFSPHWPHVTVGSGRVDFERAGMEVAADSATIGGAGIREGRAQARDFDRDPWLAISGRIATSLPQTMDFLSQTPLRGIPERLLAFAQPQGDADIGLNLGIYLGSDRDEVKVDGRARLKGARLDFPGLGMVLRQITGELGFSERGLRAENLSASIFGRPAKITVGEGEEAVRVDVRGSARTEDLRDFAPQSALWDVVRGSFDYRLLVDVTRLLDPARPRMKLEVSSDLKGLEVALPAPLGKSAAAGRESQMELSLPLTANTPLRVRYGNDASAQCWFAESGGDWSLFGGDLYVGAAEARPPRERNLRLHARLNELDLGPWRTFLAGAPGRTIEQGLFGGGSLAIADARWDGRKLGSVILDLRREAGSWKGRIESSLAKGEFVLQVPEFGHPVLNLDLESLSLPEPDGGKRAAAGPDDPSPDRMPVIQLHARRTLWRGADLGALALTTERWTQGLNVRNLTLRHPNHLLEVKGGWMQMDGRDETKLDGKWTVDDLGAFLASLGYAKEIRDTPAEARFSLSWPGAPQQLAAARVRGGIDLNLGRGSVLKMEPGLGRALAVLNLDSLRRLLLLDFSDLFGQGLSYDSMRGRFELGGGHARTSGFVIDAVAGTILISGRVGLVQKDLDEIVTVVPHTLASLPIGGVMMGGAAVGAALSMAGKLVGQDSVSLASNRYEIKGSWDNPKVSRIEGNMTLDVLNRAWSGFKNFSGFGSTGEESGNE